MVKRNTDRNRRRSNIHMNCHTQINWPQIRWVEDLHDSVDTWLRMLSRMYHVKCGRHQNFVWIRWNRIECIFRGRLQLTWATFVRLPGARRQMTMKYEIHEHASVQCHSNQSINLRLIRNTNEPMTHGSKHFK